MFKSILAALAATILLAPVAAGAQAMPSYAQASGEENIHGRITSFDGRFTLAVRDERGYVDNVQLHQGTIINPTGITLEPGMIVSVLGYNAGSFLAANEVDTPYTYVVGVPYWQGHPWFYYGPTVSLGFFFGNPGWWHGSYFTGGYRWVGGARVYATPFRPVYAGGSFQGRAYVASPARGGYVPHGGYAPHPNGGYVPQRGPAPEERGRSDQGHDRRDH